MKADASDADAERDRADCWFAAQGESLAELNRDPDREKFITAIGSRRLTFHPPGAEALRFLRQRELFVRCMEDKGYGQRPAAE